MQTAVRQKKQETERGFINFHNRWYDSELGKWISRDPIGELGGMNLYAYADNNPVNLWDVTGLCPEDSTGGGDKCLEQFKICTEQTLDDAAFAQALILTTGIFCLATCAVVCTNSNIGYPICFSRCALLCAEAVTIAEGFSNAATTAQIAVCALNFSGCRKEGQ